MNVISNIQLLDTNYKTAKDCSQNEGDHSLSVLSGEEKVLFLRKCCASPLLRFILHLLMNDGRKENLCTWYGGPFGVRIWDTKKFTESYNTAMRTNMNFTNISRALQSCEHITIAGNRLWKRIKQGEYSFFPTYKGHGIPPIPPSAMPRNIPAYFPFERYGIVKSPHTRLQVNWKNVIERIEPISTHHHTQKYSQESFPNQTNQYSLTNYISPLTPLVSPPLMAPSHLYSPCSVESPAYLVEQPCITQNSLNFVPTPSPSDTSSSSSDSLCFNESLLPQPHSSVYIPLHESCKNQYLIHQETADKGKTKIISTEQVGSFQRCKTKKCFNVLLSTSMAWLLQ
ncbi:hypothetical protein DICVIV_13014 [Dictyocaulus viviparus]|uniref:ETS domain-containing protein n=1 Tax=Dictyocaulus viviparus TaxID=29172 RepID=A0A0D8X8Y1_DICVI|nr:hypothetical protein DICVIV_13014 [Dictyocaulus viviparus]